MKKIYITRGKVALCDDEDYHWLNQLPWFAVPGPRTWYAARNSAPYQSGKRRQICMHQFLCFGGDEIDHKNGNGLDNRKKNLRFTNKNGNQHNKRKMSGKTSSRFKGVCWHKTMKRWVSRIAINKRTMCLGYFNDEAEAAKAYDRAALEKFREFAKPNFP